MDTEMSTTMGPEQDLDDLAGRIARQGTRDEAVDLTALAAAARPLCPGAAAALIDWEGDEVARLRAFGIVHGALLRAGVVTEEWIPAVRAATATLAA